MKKSLQLLLVVCLASHPVLSAKNAKPEPTEFHKPVIEKIEGWTIELDPALKAPDQQKLLRDVRKAMANHLQRIVYILPPEKTKALRKLPIRIDLEHKLTNMRIQSMYLSDQIAEMQDKNNNLRIVETAMHTEVRNQKEERNQTPPQPIDLHELKVTARKSKHRKRKTFAS